MSGNHRPQTFKNCEKCGKLFGPLNHLKTKYCSVECKKKAMIGKPTKKKGRHYPLTNRAETRICPVCYSKFRAANDINGRFGGKRIRKQIFCSKECCQKTWINRVKIDPEKHRLSLPRGERNHAWVGDKVLYAGVHCWIRSHFGNEKKCEHCGSEIKKKYEWANKDHKHYTRNRKDWMRLCTSCHRKYDIKNCLQGLATEYRLKKININSMINYSIEKVERNIDVEASDQDGNKHMVKAIKYTIKIEGVEKKLELIFRDDVDIPRPAMDQIVTEAMERINIDKNKEAGESQQEESI